MLPDDCPENFEPQVSLGPHLQGASVESVIFFPVQSGRQMGLLKSFPVHRRLFFYYMFHGLWTVC